MKITKSELRKLIKEELFKETTDRRVSELVDDCVDALGEKGFIKELIGTLPTNMALDKIEFIMKINKIEKKERPIGLNKLEI